MDIWPLTKFDQEIINMELQFPTFSFGFRSRNSLPIILQSEGSECALACLAMISAFYGKNKVLMQLRHDFAIGVRGATLKDVISIATQMDLLPRAVRVELEDMEFLPLPCILHWNLNHFVVLKEVRRTRSGKLTGFVIHDPARGAVRISIDEASQNFTGVALELSPSVKFTKEEKPKTVSLSRMIGSTPGVKRALAQVFLIAVVLEVFALLTPLYMQLVVDGAIATSDRDLLTIAALGFGMLIIIQGTLSVFRSWVLIYLGSHLNVRWLDRVFSHLIRLPMHYFERRHLGDVVSRFGSVQQIQKTISTTFVAAILDGILGIATFGMLLFYSPYLAFVALSILILYALIRILMYEPLRSVSDEQIFMHAREQTILLESVRGIQTIKLFGAENDRRSRWVAALVDATNRDIRSQSMVLGFNTLHVILAGLENILIIYLAAKMTISKEFSLGMMFAFLSYKSTFTGRVYGLIDKLLELKMISVHSERVADIIFHESESVVSDSVKPGRGKDFGISTEDKYEPKGLAIDVRDVWFRYSDLEPWILQGVSFSISAGESVALVGKSGCGKTTLLKVMLGLLPPTKGEIYVNGEPMASFGRAAFREQLAAVMQDDVLFVGSIAENVSFFCDEPDEKKILECLAAAAVDIDILGMPMGVRTLVGDMGSTLSGGQKQRILLARALYKNPRILFLDEATSHLDAARETQVNQAIIGLSVTRIIVAHRAETVASVERVIEMSGGLVSKDVSQANTVRCAAPLFV